MDDATGSGGDGPMAVLIAALDSLAAVPADRLTVAQLQGAVPSLMVQLDRMAGVRDKMLAELDARGAGQVPPGGPADEHSRRSVATAWWLREASRVGGPQAGWHVRQAGLLARLPRVAAAVIDGRVGHAQALVLTRLLDRLSDDELQECQDDLVLLASARDPQWLAAWVREQIATHCEPVLEQSAEAASRRRYLQLRDNHDGTLFGRFVLPTEQTEALQLVIEALSRSNGPGEDRSALQRRADSLLDVFELAAKHGTLPDHGGLRPQISYLLPAGWAAHMDPPPFSAELAAALGPQRDGGEAAEIGEAPNAAPPRPDVSPESLASPEPSASPGLPVSPSRAASAEPATPYPAPSADASASSSATAPSAPACPREREPHDCTPAWPGRSWSARGSWSGPQTRAHLETVLCDARIDRMLMSPRGQVRGLTTLRDSVTPLQRRALVARDGGCAARGCRRPPAFCDAHHLSALAHGGRTVLANLVLLCRYHHRRWHLGRLQLNDLHAPWHDEPVPHPPDLHLVRDG